MANVVDGAGPVEPGQTAVALVTGAGRGIGRAVATRLSAAGHRVVVAARTSSDLEVTRGGCPGPTLAVVGDVTDPVFVEECFTAAERRWGPVGVLVANAGAGVSAPLARTTDEQWQQMLDVNLTAPFRFVRRAVPAMTEAGYGRVVVVASVAARIGEPYIAAYTASKHGVLGLVRSAAAELARTGVTVNAVCPGYVDTPMTGATVDRIAERTGRTPAEARATLAGKQAFGRLVTPDEVAQTVVFCVANGAVNGQGLTVDGGTVQA